MERRTGPRKAIAIVGPEKRATLLVRRWRAAKGGAQEEAYSSLVERGLVFIGKRTVLKMTGNFTGGKVQGGGVCLRKCPTSVSLGKKAHSRGHPRRFRAGTGSYFVGGGAGSDPVPQQKAVVAAYQGILNRGTDRNINTKEKRSMTRYRCERGRKPCSPVTEGIQGEKKPTAYAFARNIKNNKRDVAPGARRGRAEREFPRAKEWSVRKSIVERKEPPAPYEKKKEGRGHWFEGILRGTGGGGTK